MSRISREELLRRQRRNMAPKENEKDNKEVTEHREDYSRREGWSAYQEMLKDQSKMRPRFKI